MAIQYGTSGPVVTFTYIYIYLQDVPVFVHEAAGNSGLSDAQPIDCLALGCFFGPGAVG